MKAKTRLKPELHAIFQLDLLFDERNLLRAHRRMISERRHHHGALLKICDLHALECIHIPVMCADIVVNIIMQRIEAWHAGSNEAQVIGVADALHDIATRTQIAERLQPRIEDRFDCFIVPQIPTIYRPRSRINV